MKVKKYAVSVQWGSGHHYFVSTEIKDLYELDYEIQRARMNTKVKHLKAIEKSKRSPKPLIHVWRRTETVKV